MANKKDTTSKTSVANDKEIAAPKTVKTAVAKTATIVTAQPGSLSIPVLSLVGAASGTLTLPEEFFGAKVNKPLLAQAVRVYATNQRTQPGNTKTRGEVAGSTRKIYRQKGTGNARHGAKYAPIFVGGGIAFGPKPRKTILDLPKKMKKAALISALSQKVEAGEIVALEGLEKATGKTKQMFKFMESISKLKGQGSKKKYSSALFIVDQKMEQAARAVQNIQGVNFLTVGQLNAYEIISHQSLILTKAAVERLQHLKVPSEKESQGVESKKAVLKTSTVRAPRPATKKEIK